MLNNAGILQNLQKQFALGNKKTDIYIIVKKLPKWEAGATSIFSLANNSIAAKRLVLLKIRNNVLPKMDLTPMIKHSLNNNKTPIIVSLSEQDVLDASKGGKALARLAFTIAHETHAHALNDKSGKETTTETQDHRNYYNDKSLTGSDSPSYDKIKKDSPAGRDKAKIEKAVKKFDKNNGK